MYNNRPHRPKSAITPAEQLRIKLYEEVNGERTRFVEAAIVKFKLQEASALRYYRLIKAKKEAQNG